MGRNAGGEQQAAPECIVVDVRSRCYAAFRRHHDGVCTCQLSRRFGRWAYSRTQADEVWAANQNRAFHRNMRPLSSGGGLLRALDFHDGC